MAESLLECYRLDRYEFEVFIGQLKPTALGSSTYSERYLEENDVLKSKQNNEEEELVQKHTIRTVMGNVLQMDICNYDDKSCDDHVDDQCLTYHNDVLNSTGSFTDIVNRLAERYVVDETPICNARSICYKFTDDRYIRQNTKSVTINKGVTCIFACVPRILIQFIQMNPLQLTIYADPDDGDGEQIEFGEASVTLSGPAGFTDAIARHFYMNGRGGPYSHTLDTTLDVYGGSDDLTATVVGSVSVRVALACHGPETRRWFVPVSTMPDRPPLRPEFVGPSCDGRFGGPIVQPPPKMMYDDAAVTGHDGPRSRCPSVGRKSSGGTDESRCPTECSCLCEELLKNVKRILFDGPRKQKDSAAYNDCDAKTRPDAGFEKPRAHHRQPTAGRHVPRHGGGTSG